MNITRDHTLADWKYEKIMEQIKEFESTLSSEEEIGCFLASFGIGKPIYITDVAYQNPDLVYFYGLMDGREAQLIQHVSQINILLTSMPKINKNPRRIGFNVSTYSEE